MNKKIIITTLVIGTVLTAIFVAKKPFKNNIKPSASVETISPIQELSEIEAVTVSIIFNDPVQPNMENIRLELSLAETVFQALETVAAENLWELKTEQYDFGVFVKSIKGYESTADKAWIYFINGKSGQTAADQTKVKPGDLIEWKYVKPY